MAESFSFEEASSPSASVGAPGGSGQFGPGTKYTADQMARLNSARDDLRAQEARGEPSTYGAEARDMAANTFSFDDAKMPAAAPAEKSQSFMEQAKQPWQGETFGSLIKQNMFANLARYSERSAELQPALEKQYDAGKADGSITEPFAPWMERELAKAYQAKYSEKAPELVPDVEWSKLPKQVYDAAVKHPVLFVSEMAKALVIDPQLLAMPELGVASRAAKVGKVAETVARTGEVAAQGGVQSAGISAARQMSESGDVQAPVVEQEAASGAVGMATLSILHSAVNLGIESIARRKGATVSAEDKAKVQAEMTAAMDAGASPTDALMTTLAKHGMDRKTANGMADAVEPYLEAKAEVPAEGAAKAPADNLGERNATDVKGQEDQGSNVQGVRGEEGQAGVLREREQGVDQGSGEEAQKVTPGNTRLYRGEYPDGKGMVGFTVGGEEFKGKEKGLFFSDDRDGIARQVAATPGTKLVYIDVPTENLAKWKSPLEGINDFIVPDAVAAGRKPHTPLSANETKFVEPPENSAPLEYQKVEIPPGETPAEVKASLPPAADGEWYHYTRAPGTRDLRVDKSNPGNIRGAAIYASKEPQLSHGAPRVDAKGNLGEKQPGELLKVKADESRMFDEAKMWEPEAARDFLEDAGMTSEEAGAVVGKRPQVAGRLLNAELKKFYGGWDYSNAYLKEKGATGVKFYDKAGKPLAALFDDAKAEPVTPLNRQAGRADLELLTRLGLVGVAGLAAYTLTGDKTDAIGAAALAGALPFAAKLVGRLRGGTMQIAGKFWQNSRFNTKQIFRDYYTNVHVPSYAIDVWKRGIEKMLKGEPDIKASYQRIRDFTQGHTDVALSPREHAAAQELRKFLDQMGEHGQDAKVLRSLIENYLPGLYQKKPFASWRDMVDAIAQGDGFRGNYVGMGQASKHALQKVIPDYRTVDALIKQGKLDLVPLTDNPFEMAALYGKALNKTIANRKLVDTLKATPGPNVNSGGKATPLIVPITTRDAAARIAQGNAIKAKQMFGDDPVEMERMKEIWNRFDIMSAPTDYVPIEHPALEGLRVHRDIAGPLKLLFDTSDPGATSRAVYALSMGAKSALFSFSLFHAGALATVAGTMVLTRPSMWRGLSAARGMIMGDVFRPEVAHWIESGLTISHHVQDVDPTFFQRAANLAEKYAQGLPAYSGMPAVAAVKGMRYAHNAINRFMWQELQPTLKLATAMAEEQRWMTKNPTGDRTQAARDIASSVNTLYGGINWFEMANNVQGDAARTVATALYSPQGRRWQQIMLLSPDWLHASLGAWTEGIKASLPGIAPKASDSLYRSYLLMSALTYLGTAQYLQQHYTKENIWDKPDWTYVDMGDGRRIQLNKHFMEAVHLLTAPGKFIINKLNYIPKESLAQLFHKEYVTVDAQGSLGGPAMQSNRVVHAAKNLVSPISASNLLSDPVAAVSGFFGVPIYGMTYEDQEKRARAQAKDAGKDEDKAAATVQRRKAKAESQRKVSP